MRAVMNDIALPSSQSLQQRDKAHVWHTWSPHMADRTSTMLVRSRGSHVFGIDGQRYLDCSALNTTVGYGCAEVVTAIQTQLMRLPGVDISLGSHDVVGELATRLSEHTPPAIDRFLFVNSGSEAWDAALFVLASYWQVAGERRNRFVAFRNGYQGSTIASRSLSGLPRVSHPLTPPVDVSYVDLPFAAKDMRTDAALERLLERFRDAIDAEDVPPAAVIVEPLLNVGGAVVLPDAFLAEMAALCDERNTLLAVDEVFTGCGRCGSVSMSAELGSTPDLLVLSKGMAGGYMPIAALGVTDAVYAMIGRDADFGGLRYGHTTSGHAAACAASLATLDILERDRLCERSHRLGARLRAGLAGIGDLPGVVDIRGRGQVTAIQLDTAHRAAAVAGSLNRSGVLVRQPGDYILVCPPLVITEGETDALSLALHDAVGSAC